MELINDRYRVIKRLNSNLFIQPYLVSDIHENFKLKQINILSDDIKIKESYFENIGDAFEITDLYTEKVCKVLELGVIYSVDNKRIDNLEYYYLTEYIDNNVTTMKFLESINEKNIMDIFFSLVKSINYLNLKNYKYGSLYDNLIVNYSHFKYDFKLKDIATIILERYLKKDANELYVQSVNQLMKDTVNEFNDIYYLGIMFYYIINKEISSYDEIEGKILSYKNNPILLNNKNYSEEFLYKAYELIYKMIHKNKKNGYKSIKELMEDINLKFNKDYNLINDKELKKLTFNNRIIGRKEEISEIMRNKNNIKIFEIKGVLGIGKTRLLKELERVFVFKNYKVFSTYNEESYYNNGTNKDISRILKKIIPYAEETIINNYIDELIKFIPEIDKNNKLEGSDTLTIEVEDTKRAIRICNFIKETLKDSKVIFIIDNLNFASKFLMQLLQYYVEKDLIYDEIVIIYSLDNYSYDENLELRRFITHEKDKEYFKEITLNSLKKEHVYSLIKHILGTKQNLHDLVQYIEEVTHGTPGCIEEILKELFIRNYIYIDDNEGIWKVNQDYKKIYECTFNMEKGLKNQYNNLDYLSKMLLGIISILGVNSTHENISKCVIEEVEDLEHKLKELVISGLISYNIKTNSGFYSINNKEFKTLVYTNLEEKYKNSVHRIAGEFLESIENKTNDIINEIIYHYERINEPSKVKKYSILFADKMKALNNFEEEIKYLIKALGSYNVNNKESCKKNEKVLKEQCQLFIRMGDLYNSNKKEQISLGIYCKALKISRSIKDYSVQTEVLRKISVVYENKGNLTKAIFYIKEAQKISKNTNNEEAFNDDKLREARIYYLNSQYEKVEAICREILDLYGQSEDSMLGKAYALIGNVYYGKSNYDKSKEFYEKAYDIFVNNKDEDGLSIVVNNLGVMNLYVYNNLEEGEKYLLQSKVICEKKGQYDHVSFVLINLSNFYVKKSDYENALMYCIKSLNLSNNINLTNNCLSSNNILILIYCKLGMYKEAYKYFLINKEKFSTTSLNYLSEIEYYEKCCNLFLELKDIDSTKEYFTKYVSLTKSSNEGNEEEIKYIKTMESVIKVAECNDNEKLKNLIIELINNFSVFTTENEKKELLIELAISLSTNNLEVIKVIYEELCKIQNCYFSERIRAGELYINSIIKSEDGLELLKEALESCKKSSYKNLEWRIYNSIAEYHLKEKNYYSALNCLMEACEIIKYLTLQLSEKFRINYFKRNFMKEPFEKLIFIKEVFYDNFFYNNKGKYNNSKINLEVHNNNELEILFAYEYVESLFKNRDFIKLSIKNYMDVLSKGITHKNHILMNLQLNSIKNLEMIINYLTCITLSTYGCIILKKSKNEIEVLASTNNKGYFVEQIIKKAKESREPIMINKSNISSYKIDICDYDLEACICIPVIINKNILIYNSDLNGNYVYEDEIAGYIYLESTKKFHNLNNKTIGQCNEFINIIGFIIEKYKFKIAASIDELTGTVTRKYLENCILNLLQNAKNTDDEFSIIMFDLDDFKKINDKFGHQMGDKVLKNVCSTVLKNIRLNDICGRYGGEEFIVALPSTNAEDAFKLAEELKTSIEKSDILDGRATVTVSMGISSYPCSGEQVEELIKKADQALYVSKELGKNRCVTWKNDFKTKAKTNDRLTGIITGDSIKDYRTVSSMINIIELNKKNLSYEDKVYKILGEVMETVEAEYSSFLRVNKGEFAENFTRKKLSEELVDFKDYNMGILNLAKDTAQGIYMVDWDEISEVDAVTGIPNWYSIMATPIIKNDIVIGVLYLKVSIKTKEFKYDDLNLVNTLGDIVANILQERIE